MAGDDRDDSPPRRSCTNKPCDHVHLRCCSSLSIYLPIPLQLIHFGKFERPITMSEDKKNDEQCEPPDPPLQPPYTALAYKPSTWSFFPSIAFTIQPHPAKDNHPTQDSGNGLQDDPEQSGGLRASNPNAMAGAGPVILDNETANNLEQPKSREEVSLFARASCPIVRFVRFTVQRRSVR
jgi:hypothetical protein